MRSMLIHVRLYVLLVVVVLTLSAVTTNAATVLTVQDLNWRGGSEFYKSIAAEFEQEHPGVKVEFINCGSRNESREKVPFLAAAGTIPDVIVMQHRVKNSWLNMGLVADITPYIEREEGLLEGFVPYAREFITWKERYWGLPESWEVWLAHVNRDAFELAGLSQPDELYESGEWNFDSLRTVGRKLTKRNSDGAVEQIGIWTNVDNELAYPWVWGFGGQVVSPDGTEMYLDSPEVRQGLGFFARLLHEDRIANTSLNAAPNGITFSGFKAGKWGLAFWWSDIMYHLTKAWQLPYSFDVLPFPAGPKSNRTNLIGLCTAWSISAQSEQKDLAWDFVKFATSREVDAKRVKERNMWPQYIENIPMAVEYINAETGRENLYLLLEALDTMGKPYHSLVDLQVSKLFTDLLKPVWRGTEPLEKVLEQIIPAIEAKLREARTSN